MNINEIPDAETATEETDDTLESEPETEENTEQDELRKQLAEYYWCKPSDKCVQSLVKKISEYYQYVTATGKMALWRLCFEQYNRGFITLGSVSRGGTEGELLN